MKKAIAATVVACSLAFAQTGSTISLNDSDIKEHCLHGYYERLVSGTWRLCIRNAENCVAVTDDNLMVALEFLHGFLYDGKTKITVLEEEKMDLNPGLCDRFLE